MKTVINELVRINRELNGNDVIAKDIKKTNTEAIRITIKLLVNNQKELKLENNISNRVALNLLKSQLDLSKFNTKLTRTIKVSLKILEGYKLNYNELSLSQMEQLTCFSKELVNQIPNDENYLTSIKDLISKAKTTKTQKVFSKALAKEV